MEKKEVLHYEIKKDDSSDTVRPDVIAFNCLWTVSYTHLDVYKRQANQYVGSTVRAATWNKELAYRMGTIYGDECLANGISGMYGMTVNIHRSPFGGRSFESYSEDPVSYTHLP